MRIKPYIVGSIGTNCYLVWDEESKEAMIIDPGVYESAIARELDDNGLTLKYIALTHGHDDHIGGVEKFKEVFPGALLAVGKEEGVSLMPDLDLTEGDTLTLGQISFRIIETPGHTKGGVTYYTSALDPGLLDGSFSGVAFTGDTLFHASIGRTDFQGGNFAVIIDSIKSRLFVLPDDTVVLPGHMDGTTIGYEKKNNPFVR